MAETGVQTGLSPAQDTSIGESTARINVWEGSVRSGKTIASLIRWMIYVATSHVQGELVVVSRTRASAARNVFAPLQNADLFGAWSKHVSYTAGADYGTILGRKVWVLGSSDTRSENVIRGLTCSGAYVDEMTLLKRDFFTQLLNRLWEGAKLFGTTNPDNPAHWLKVDFLDRTPDVGVEPTAKQLPDWRRWKFVLDDNPALSEERKAAIRRENVGLFYRRNVLGEWVAAEGAIYPMWEPDLMTVTTLPEMERLIAIGMDYGTTNATAAVLLGVAPEFDLYGNVTRRRLYVVDEWRHDSRQSQVRLTDAQLSAQFRDWLHDLQARFKRDPEYIFLDPAAASMQVQLLQDGLGNVRHADNSVTYGIATVASLFASGSLRVSATCTGLLSEIPGYSWDDKATLRGEDKPIKVADHSLDALRYAVTTTETIWRPLIDLTQAA